MFFKRNPFMNILSKSECINLFFMVMLKKYAPLNGTGREKDKILNTNN